MVIEIYRAADAFLYLPTYVAEEYKIFETLFSKVASKYPNISIKFMPIDSQMNGDGGAFNRMHEANATKPETLSIAICSPAILLSNDIEAEKAKDCCAIAALIDKLPFWGINHKGKEFSTIDELSTHFKSVVYLNENYKEGNYLGKILKQRKNINKGFPVTFGEEIDVLEKEYTNNENPIAISADLVRIIKGVNRKVNPLVINYRFSKDKKYLTTGLLTHKNAARQYPELLSLIIEGIQKSISTFYSSNYIAETICKKIAPLVDPTLIPSELEIQQIVYLINSEKFYPADLNISRKSWTEAIQNLSSVEIWDDKKKQRDFIYKSYSEYVDNTFVLNSEKSIADQFGINLDTFEKEIKRKPLYAFPFYTSKCLRIFYNWILNSSLKFFIVFILGAITLTSLYFWNREKTAFIYPVIFTITGGALASLIAAYVYDIRNGKDGK